MFEYRIYKSVYDDIKSGKKTIEYRLLNEKSKKIKKGDFIRFKVLNNEKEIIVEVVDKYIYDNIDELWNDPKTLVNALDYTKEEFQNALYEIFGKNEVLNSKIVGIEFKIKR